MLDAINMTEKKKKRKRSKTMNARERRKRGIFKISRENQRSGKCDQLGFGFAKAGLDHLEKYSFLQMLLSNADNFYFATCKIFSLR